MLNFQRTFTNHLKTMQVKKHYKEHLSHFYSWMVGDIELKIADFRNFLMNHHIEPKETKVAIDLGAGNGIQSIALKESGFEVTAIDFDERLLNELKSNRRAKGIETVQSDIRDIIKFRYLKPELIVCCGDTITHLDNKKQIKNLIEDSKDILTRNGQLILTFRDYSHKLNDRQRFIPVKSSSDRILTCILEYNAEKVKVTDLLYEKKEREWKQKVSSYEKVRISTSELVEFIEHAGMEISVNEPVDGMQTLVANVK
jgi:2-polyprenyl-3-methyl-5-hydroxy-6-metoxy-1,4-benzoquinol methylase